MKNTKSYRRIYLVKIALFTCIFLQGCMIEIAVHSDPSATVVMDGKKIGATPCRIQVPYWWEYALITLEKDGYVTRDEMIVRNVLDGSKGLFATGWPESLYYELMTKEESFKRQNWLKKSN